MYSSSSSLYKTLKILVAVASVLDVISPPLAFGNPITKRQFQKVVKLLEESLATEIPSDDADQYSDILFQETFDKRNLTFYHAGNPKFPVFISNGLGSVGSQVHVLLRGEDYINPKDRNNFVVLRQLGSPAGAYSVHQAHILDVILKLKKGSKVIWNDCRVEQQKNIKSLLQQMGNSEVQARSTRAQRPLCDWIGYSLFCQTAKNVPPYRERKERDPLDEEDDEPVQLPGIVSEENKGPEGVGIGKRKRYVGIDISKDNQNGVIKRKVGNEIENEVYKRKVATTTKKPTFRKIKTEKPTTRKTTTTSTTTTSTTTTTTTTPTPITTKRAVIVQEVTNEEVTDKPAEEEEQVTKKKHKKKRKSKRKHADVNKEVR